MAEITYQMVLSTLQTVGLLVGTFYYIMTLQNTRKNQQMQLETRQAQLLTNLFNTFRSLEFRRLFHQVLVYDWKDFDDWCERYNEKTNPEAIVSFSSVMNFFKGIGVLVKNNLIDIKLVYDLMAGEIKLTWERYLPIFIGDRELFNNPMMWGDFEYLYNLIIEIDEDPESMKLTKEYFEQLSTQTT